MTVPVLAGALVALVAVVAVLGRAFPKLLGTAVLIADRPLSSGELHADSARFWNR
jgi:hypothetical protein